MNNAFIRRFTSGIIRIGTIILATLLILPACTNQVDATTPIPTATTHILLTPVKTSTIKPAYTTTPTLILCKEKTGKVIRRAYDSNLLRKPQYLSIYLPPCFDLEPIEFYPVIYLLHAQTFEDDQYERLGAVDAADKLISSGVRQPFIMVMPFEENNVKYSGDSLFNQVIVAEIIPWIDANYPTCDGRECRVIDGISRGAAWAMKCGLATPELFSKVAAHSFPGFYNAEGLLRDWLVGESLDNLPVIAMDSGKSDYFISEARIFDALLTQFGIEHSYIEKEGNHDEKYWAEHMQEYMEWDSVEWH